MLFLSPEQAVSYSFMTDYNILTWSKPIISNSFHRSKVFTTCDYVIKIKYSFEQKSIHFIINNISNDQTTNQFFFKWKIDSKNKRFFLLKIFHSEIYNSKRNLFSNFEFIQLIEFKLKILNNFIGCLSNSTNWNWITFSENNKQKLRDFICEFGTFTWWSIRDHQ